MCGVVSIVYGESNDELGREAAFLLKKLEYRGYDSTGAAFFGADGSVLLKKKVGGPTKVIEELEIERDGGLKFIGQVRWATYGSVTDTNAQPHEMACRCHIVGAHNGNISNTDTLKEFLVDNGHRVLSDNDGEMLTHVIEHFYDEISHLQHPSGDEERIRTMVRAIRQTHRKVDGSYAACVALPDLPGVFAIKAGSSLYAGKGSDANGPFIVVSSDLTSVLSKTRFLIPLAEGEGIYFTENEYFVFSMETDRIHQPKLTRSRLNVADITLQGRYKYFMQQEIYTASENIDRLLKYYFMEEDEKALFEVFERHIDRCQGIVFEVLKFYDIFDQAALRQALDALFASEDYRTVFDAAREFNGRTKPPVSAPVFTSDEAALLSEILGMENMPYPRLRLIDQIIIWKKKRLIVRYRDELIRIIRETAHRGGRTFLVGAGTSYHAALIGGYFFNNIARVSVIPANPGLFRSLYINGLTDHDTIIGITQSGETKDLLDIFNDVRRAHGENIHLISIVNNEISTIPQEKSDFFLPILCGPEIAVAATKSFISQIALFYLLAQMMVLDPGDVRAQVAKVRSVLDFTLKDIEEDVAEVALRLFLKPSIHILGTSLMGLAREGALKIREVVLNHTEGYDSAEFKHGPNTILGKNTIYSLEDMENLVVDAFEFFGELLEMRFNQSGTHPEKLESLMDLFKDIQFKDFDFRFIENLPADSEERRFITDTYHLYKRHVALEKYFSNYPLIFICPPDSRDTKITITQIHTHKIRGADVILIAQDDDDLWKAVSGKPAGFDDYYAKYIKVPKMFDKNMFVFQAAIVLQLLALRMSVDKMKYLNKNHVENHGVHPDVPKNVSKSITVD